MMNENVSKQTAFVKHIASIINQHGWQFPVLMALEGGRPLTLLGGQLMWVMQPVLSLFIATDTIRQTAQLLEDPIAVDALIARLQVDDL